MNHPGNVVLQQFAQHSRRVSRVGRRNANIIDHSQRFTFPGFLQNRFDEIAALAARPGFAKKTRDPKNQPARRSLTDQKFSGQF